MRGALEGDSSLPWPVQEIDFAAAEEKFDRDAKLHLARCLDDYIPDLDYIGLVGVVPDRDSSYS